MTAGTTTSLQVIVYVGSNALPDCYYAKSTALTSLSLQRVLISGDSTHPDARLRLVSQFPNLKSLYLVSVTFQNENSSPMDFTSFFNAVPLLTLLQFNSITFGSNVTLSAVTLPSKLCNFQIIYSGLTGTISETLGSTLSCTFFTFDLRFNSLTGTLPARVFSGLQANPTTLLSLSVQLQNNQLEGTFPETVFEGYFPNVASLVLVLSNNRFSGPISNVFGRSGFNSLAAIVVTADSNFFDGALTNWFAPNCSLIYSLSISLNDNSLTGSFPSDYYSGAGFSSTARTIYVSLSRNQLSGGLPSGLFNISGSTTMAFNLFVDSNQLDGTIASDIFAPTLLSNITSFNLQAKNNLLHGAFPSAWFGGWPIMNSMSVTIDFSANSDLSGSLPSNWLSSLLPTTSYTTSATLSLTLQLGYTGLTGELVLPDLSSHPATISLVITTNGCNLASITIHPNAYKYVVQLNLSGNRMLKGTIPDSLYSSKLTALTATDTALSGTMPDLGTMSLSHLTVLELSSTNIDFCSGNRTAWSSTTLNGCALLYTNAFYCQNMYPTVCRFSAPLPVSVPVSTATCPSATRPSLDFQCIGSVWTSVGTITTPELVIPAGATETIITGNITSTSIVIAGLGSTVVIEQGCANNLSLITIELTAEDVKKLSSSTTQLLISLDSDANCTLLDDVQVHLTVTGDTCRKAKAQKVTTSQTLSALFTVNQSSCNTWWIILLSVLVAVVIIAAVTLALLTFFVPSVRNIVRPFSKRTAEERLT